MLFLARASMAHMVILCLTFTKNHRPPKNKIVVLVKKLNPKIRNHRRLLSGGKGNLGTVRNQNMSAVESSIEIKSTTLSQTSFINVN